MCGEYGERFGRPHYHALLFNFDFKDKYYWRTTKQKNIIYRSDELEKLWPFGLSDIGTVTSKSASYVAGYIQKKITGEAAEGYYLKPNRSTGELVEVIPEYNGMSLKPGIAKDWYDKYWKDVFPSDSIHMDGKRVIVPKYYLDQLKDSHPWVHEMVKAWRVEDFKEISQEELEKRELAIKYKQSKPKGNLQ